MRNEELHGLMKYDPETGDFTWTVSRGKVKPGQLVGWSRADGYKQTRIDGQTYYLHRLAWFFVHGELPLLIDHIDRDPSNNRIANLRPASRALNARNSKVSSRNKSGFRGVHWNAQFGKWKAVLFADGKNRHVSHADTPELASEAYEQALVRFQGETA
jgi:hypothetical protein